MRFFLYLAAAVALLWLWAQMSIKLKPGATLDGAKPVTLFAVDLAASLRKLIGGGDTTVTAGTDSHPAGDVHTLGYAADLRTNDLNDSLVKIWYGLLKTMLTPLGFDVILETSTGTGPHIHIEYDPKIGRAIPGIASWRI